MIRPFFLILFLSSVYTYVRYVIFGDVSHEHIPVFLLNKALSMTAVICLFFTALSSIRKQMKSVVHWGNASMGSALIHVALSFCILSKAYYPKFFGDERLNLVGELMLFFGVLAIYAFWFQANAKISLCFRKYLQVLVSFLISAHLFVMGCAGWLNVSGWHGSLAPISLVSFVFSVASMFLFVKYALQTSTTKDV